jgi:hypothetical protein
MGRGETVDQFLCSTCGELVVPLDHAEAAS